MNAYSIIMFVVALIFYMLGAMLYNGNTDLIHDYHQTRVKSERKREYGKAFSKGMFVIASALLISGIIALLGDTKEYLAVSGLVLFVGLIAGCAIFGKVQNKYSKGLF